MAAAAAAVDAPTATSRPITGKVWAPNQGPGQAMPAGQEIPIAGALVYVTRAAAGADPAAACTASRASRHAARQRADRRRRQLRARRRRPGHYWLVIEKGQFRLEQEYELAARHAERCRRSRRRCRRCTIPRPAATCRRSRSRRGNERRDRGHPRQARRSARWPATSFTSPMARLDRVRHAHYAAAPATPARSRTCCQNIAEMRKYHIIFFPCQADVPSAIDTLLPDQTILANIRQLRRRGRQAVRHRLVGRDDATARSRQQIELGDAARGQRSDLRSGRRSPAR